MKGVGSVCIIFKTECETLMISRRKLKTHVFCMYLDVKKDLDIIVFNEDFWSE